MDKSKRFCRELPEGYEAVKTFDAANKRVGILMNVAALVLTAIVGVGGFFLKRAIDPGFTTFHTSNVWAFEGVLLAFLLVYVLVIVLHELIHGFVYHILTGQKLTFGFKLTCAFCGVPDIYVTRGTALASLLAPFTVFSVAFLIPTFLLSGPLSFGFLLLFAIHFGGCAGDLYDTYLLLFRLKGDLLMRDRGPTQTFYIKKQITNS